MLSLFLEVFVILVWKQERRLLLFHLVQKIVITFLSLFMLRFSISTPFWSVLMLLGLNTSLFYIKAKTSNFLFFAFYFQHFWIIAKGYLEITVNLSFIWDYNLKIFFIIGDLNQFIFHIGMTGVYSLFSFLLIFIKYHIVLIVSFINIHL